MTPDSYLRQEGLYDNTVIILTSDHGEEFGEHGTFGWHSHTLYDELLKVPLIIKLPNSIYSSVVIEEQTRSMDILPTLLSILDLPNTRICEGVNLVNWFARQRSKELCAISQQDTLGQAHPTTIRTKKWKLYDEKLFDLESDPLEKRDVRKDNHEIYDRLQGILSRYLNKKVYNNIETKTVNPNNETLMKLRSLGYVE